MLVPSVALVLLGLLAQRGDASFDIICYNECDTGRCRDVCTARRATETILNRFAEIYIPEQCSVRIVNSAFGRFNQSHFELFGRAENISFWMGTVREINFRSKALRSLQVMYSWLLRFEVVEEENYALKQLTIRSDLFTRISPSIRYLRGLEQIDFSMCGLTTVKLDFFAMMDNLVSLDLSENKIFSIVGAVDLQLRSLQLIELGHNRLTELSRFPEVFPSLRLVNLKKNQWDCDWVSAAREALWKQKITVVGVDPIACPGNMTNNGGLCCWSWATLDLLIADEVSRVIRTFGKEAVEVLDYYNID